MPDTTDALDLAYELLETGADQLARDGLVASYHPFEDDCQSIVIYEQSGLDAGADADDVSLHLSKHRAWPVEHVEQTHWASEGIDPTITADTGPAAEFCR